MDQYPPEEEELELMYEDEMELVNDLHETNLINIQEPSRISSQLISNSVINSPQLSQISHDGTNQQVKRCLFKNLSPGKRISSTPYCKSINTDPAQLDAIEEIQNIGLNRKRKLEDLFGDIRDIDDDFPFDNLSKKIKNEEDVDLEQINKILAARKKFREIQNPLKKDNLEKLNALHEFKRRNLSKSLPNWPSIAVMKNCYERIYVRMHSEEYETQHINEVKLFKRGLQGFLGDAKEHIWNTAREITHKRLTGNAVRENECNINLDESSLISNDILWVEKYKPSKYLDLLSDESTNRSLLQWLKMWDKVNFGKDSTKQKNISRLNTFNKKTGKFESNGGWNRRIKQALNTDKDEYDRPIQKVALLCGPPGLGKTTLAHRIAVHAGYIACEINASDDRSPEAFKLALENGTQMTSVLNNNKKPNCIILDEIDGAPQQSIEFLIKFVEGNPIEKNKKGNKNRKQILKRPIICICNDMYVPALRRLRQISFVVNFPPIESSRLAERLLEIAQYENLETDLGALLSLAEKSGNDVRSCISMMQFFKAANKRLTLEDVLNANLGQKDRNRGLFQVWNAIFQIQRPQKQLVHLKDSDSENVTEVTMTDMSAKTRMRHILDVINSGGDYEKLMQGVYESYLDQKMPDPNFNGIVIATQWFSFFDFVQQMINHLQNYVIYPYLQFGFVTWHFLFAGLAWPKIKFPNKSFEVHQKRMQNQMIMQSLRKGISPGLRTIGQGKILLLETIPALKYILSPKLRSVSLQLLTSKEKDDLKHAVEVMVDLGLNFTQIKSTDATYQYQMEPDINFISHFQGCPKLQLSYFGRQLLAREIELEQLRRLIPKTSKINSNLGNDKRKNKDFIPNHLQKLQPKSIGNTKIKETVTKDFFGRVIKKKTVLSVQEGGTDVIVKSPIWYKYKEGFNNAVRKDLYMTDLL